MRIVSDANIFGVSELFCHYGDVKVLSGSKIARSDLIGAQVLLVRTTTRVNRELLQDTSIRFVGSATSGIDHIDLKYLKSENIEFAHSPGNNANAVVQYDLSVFANLRPDWRALTIGIIGCGKVGGRLYTLLKELDVKIRVYDPFLSDSQIPELIDLHEVLKSDIVCLHTPLTFNGKHPTANLLDEEKINRLPAGALLVNASRGGVLNEDALFRRLKSKNDLHVALDVWDSEPSINLPLMNRVALATPHIAGYTLEAKKKASLMLRDAFLSWQGAAPTAGDVIVSNPKIIRLEKTVKPLNHLILACYDAVEDDKALRLALNNGNERGLGFEKLRNEYSFRHDFQYYSVPGPKGNPNELRALGFGVD